MIIYLDNCCYNRPFDDQTQERIHLESEVILTILKMGQIGEYKIVGSNILELEIEKMRDEYKKHKVKQLYEIVEEEILYSEEIRRRSEEIMSKSKIRTFDSIHIAIAETADVMLTTDDKLIKMAEKLKLKTKVMNPLKFAWEAM